MPATIQRETNNTYLLHLSGVVQRSEFENVQKSMAGAIDAGAKPRILAVLKDFQGWERGADWGDLEFHALAQQRDREDRDRRRTAFGAGSARVCGGRVPPRAGEVFPSRSAGASSGLARGIELRLPGWG